MRTEPDPTQRFLLPAFAVLALVLGSIYAFLTPPLQVPDEIGHFTRAYLLSQGECVPPVDVRIPANIRRLHNEFPARVELLRRISAGELRGFLDLPLDQGATSGLGFMASNLYHCLPYAPAAISMAVGRRLDLSPLGLMYVGRLASLLCYTAMLVWSLRLLPDFHLLLCGLALMPMTLHQAASLSADSFTIAATLLFTALVLKLALSSEVKTLTTRHYAAAGAMVVVISLCKFTLWLVPVVLLIPARKFKSRYGRALALAGYAALAILVTALWNFSNQANVAEYAKLRLLQDIDVGGNLRFPIQHPLLFGSLLWRTMWDFKGMYAQHFVGDFGYLALPLPWWWVVFYLVVILICVSAGRIVFSTTQRGVLLLVSAGSIVTNFLLLWGMESTRSLAQEVLGGRGHILGVQGRYFIPAAVPCFLLLATRRFQATSLRRWVPSMVLFSALLINVASFQMIAQWYRPSTPDDRIAVKNRYGQPGREAAARYEGRLVRRPGGTPADGIVYVVIGGERRWVPDAAWVVSHGYRWPEDVQLISAADLDRIPLGAQADK